MVASSGPLSLLQALADNGKTLRVTRRGKAMAAVRVRLSVISPDGEWHGDEVG
jgi:hypothetical protein